MKNKKVLAGVLVAITVAGVAGATTAYARSNDLGLRPTWLREAREEMRPAREQLRPDLRASRQEFWGDVREEGLLADWHEVRGGGRNARINEGGE